MPNLVDSSSSWAYTKIAGTNASVQGSDIPCKSCRVWAVGTVYMSYTTATTSDIALPTTPATAIPMPVDNLKQLYFIGADANQVAWIMYRR